MAKGETRIAYHSYHKMYRQRGGGQLGLWVYSLLPHLPFPSAFQAADILLNLLLVMHFSAESSCLE